MFKNLRAKMQDFEWTWRAVCEYRHKYLCGYVNKLYIQEIVYASSISDDIALRIIKMICE